MSDQVKKCLNCNKPTERGQSRCPYHIIKHREEGRRNDPKRKQKRVDEGKCMYCGGPKTMGEANKGCINCTEEVFYIRWR